MRTCFSLLIIPIVFWSCSASEQMDNLSGSTSLDYSLDTVLIDPGEELLFVAGRLHFSDLSPDGKYLYNFNQHDHSFEQIDLDEKKLVRKLPFEKEGPNGTGDFFRSFFLMDNDHVLIVTFPNPLIFDLNGKKLKELKFQELITDGGKTDNRQAFLVAMNFPNQEDRYLGFLRSFEAKSTELMRVDLNEGSTKTMSIPQFENLKNFELQFTDGKSSMISGPQSYLIREGGKILVGSNLRNEIYQYLPETDSLRVFTYHSQLTENEKTVPGAREFDTQEGFLEAIRQVRGEISFSAPVWDEQNKVYYRFSYKEVLEEPNTESFQWPSATSAEVFLTLFDENLDMLAETRVPDIDMPPQKHFVKDGKIWMFVNVDDEVGFARLSMDLGRRTVPSDGVSLNEN
ncbi:protein of unknown function [Cyclobacterium xiamenense]|uniref:DUF4221 domain-containing protein n=1 Tax=Cyclobacterium xiamenense TaxID=1297121 RepID=A0A1H6XNY0_9BACT|nr:DUF4221 family protein [Cyclobacterium xiamenense]SEJ30763.1 protein of unknown function [Cyclobacterium xiamenense]